MEVEIEAELYNIINLFKDFIDFLLFVGGFVAFLLDYL